MNRLVLVNFYSLLLIRLLGSSASQAVKINFKPFSIAVSLVLLLGLPALAAFTPTCNPPPVGTGGSSPSRDGHLF